jgi:hypothetical protein
MFRLKLLISVLALLFLTAVFLPQVKAEDLSSKLVQSEKDYELCFDRLPAKARWGLEAASSRGRRKWSKSLQKKVAECLEKQRLKEDYRDIIALSEVLQGFYKGDDEVDQQVLKEEAELISSVLVHTTRKLSKKYKMGKSALWHNFLIKLGSKKGGYCYEWTEAFLNALPKERFRYFERHWGVHNKGRYTENNSLIIAGRGMRIHSGIVYDTWRGKGKPYWLFVANDKQSWGELFSENEILAGAYKIEPE